MTLHLLYFASVKEALNCAAEELDRSDIATVGELIAVLSQRGAQWQRTLADNTILVAVNQTLSALDTPVAAGDEIAFFPPVTGG